MSEVINALGKLLRLNYLIISALKAERRKEDDWFKFVTKDNVDLIMQLIMAKVPWLEFDYSPCAILPMLEVMNHMYQNETNGHFFNYDDLFIISDLVRSYLDLHAGKNKSKEDKKLILYKIDFKTFFGTKTPDIKELEQLANNYRLRELTIDEIVVFRRQYLKQPENEQLLVSYTPFPFLCFGQLLAVQNILSSVNRFGRTVNGPLYVKTIGSCDPMILKPFTSIVLTNK